jgi:hypothetical protein
MGTILTLIAIIALVVGGKRTITVIVKLINILFDKVESWISAKLG